MRTKAQTLRHSPVGLVLFTLGMARVPPEEPLPGPALVELLSELGLSEAASRSTLSRLRRGGWLTSERIGRMVGYAPSPAVLAGHRRRADQFTRPSARWDGQFHALLVTVPEAERAFRDRLRRAATIAGYRMLRPGLFVAVADRAAELGMVLDRMPSGAQVTSARLTLSPADAARVASELWPLDDLGARYRAVAAAARAASAQAAVQPPVGAAAVAAFAAAALPIYAAVADDPGLPEVLLPQGWPGAELGLALTEAVRVFSPAVGEHIDRLRRAAHALTG